MRKAVLHVSEYPHFLRNAIFAGKPLFGAKNDYFSCAALRRALAAIGIDLSTQDLTPLEDAEFILCIDRAWLDLRRRPDQRCYLLLYEPPSVNCVNWNVCHHAHWDRVFTYNQEIVDDRRYCHLPYAIDMDSYPPFAPPTEDEQRARRLCVAVTGPNYGGNDPYLELNTERVQLLEWFARHHPDAIDLYGRNWEQACFLLPRLATLRRVVPQRLLLALGRRRRPHLARAYRGPIAPDGKITVMRNYRFAICYENTRVPGYISEKIYDAFFAACVPVYRGPDAVADTIPPGCFIDPRHFRSNEELYACLKGMGRAEYEAYLGNIHDYLRSPTIDRFRTETYVDTLLRYLAADLGLDVPPTRTRAGAA